MKETKIPAIYNNKVIVVENEDTTDYFYGTTNEVEFYKLIFSTEIIIKLFNINFSDVFVFYFDFKNNTKLECREWFVRGIANVYVNRCVTKDSTIISDYNGGEFEGIIWVSIEN